MKYLIEIHQGIGDVIQITGLIETIYSEDKSASIPFGIKRKLWRAVF